MRNCPDIARVEIKRLEAKGLKLTLDELAWLMSLGEKVAKPKRLGNPLIAAVPVVAGCEPFYELTNLASWWVELAHEWFDGLSVCHMLGYAHRFSRVKDHFKSDALTNQTSARQAVKEWRDSVSITDGEILDACSRFTEDDTPTDPNLEEGAEKNEDEEDNGSSGCQALAMALAVTGITQAEYEAMTPDQAGEVVKQAIMFNSESGDIAQKQAAEESAQALRNLGFAVMTIEKAHAQNV